jgi:hypothetical protein
MGISCNANLVYGIILYDEGKTNNNSLYDLNEEKFEEVLEGNGSVYELFEGWLEQYPNLNQGLGVYNVSSNDDSIFVLGISVLYATDEDVEYVNLDHINKNIKKWNEMLTNFLMFNGLNYKPDTINLKLFSYYG